MVKILILALCVVAGAGVGLFAGYTMMPENETEATDNATEPQKTQKEIPQEDLSYLEFEPQFIIPITRDDEIVEHVILSIALEAEEEVLNKIDPLMPKLRSEFLITVYDMLAIDVFSSRFANSEVLLSVTQALQEQVDVILDENVSVIITNFVRQNA